jgi:hypothetical protein
MDSQQKRQEITDLIDNIKRHSDRLSEKPNIPLLEVSVILAKITRLNEKAAVLKYMLAIEQGFHEDEFAPQHLQEHEKLIEAELAELDNQQDGNLNQAESTAKQTETAAAKEGVSNQSEPSKKEVEEFSEKSDAVEKPESADHKPLEAQDKEQPNETFLNQLENSEEIPAKPDLNEQYSDEEDPSLSEQLSKQPIADLLTAIGLNERYLYANELFGGDIEDFRKVIRTLNEFEHSDDALEYFEQHLIVSYGWKEDNELVMALKKLLTRRYQ